MHSEHTDVVGGQVVDMIDSIRFEYFRDVNENGIADDVGQNRVRIGLGAEVSGVLGLCGTLQGLRLIG